MKKMNNKGFSLVELIVVVAIMAVLIGVLSPQYLRYVEKSRLQKDNSAISEVAQSIKTAMSDEDINSNAASTESFPFTSGTLTINSGASSNTLESELFQVVGNEVKLTSNAYKNAGTQVIIEVTKTDSGCTVKAKNYIEKVGATAEDKDL